MGSDYVGRGYHTSLRSGTNVLEIEKGRWKGVHRDLRFCNQCDSKAVESEKHFLLSCSKYDTLRSSLFASIYTVSGSKWDLASKSEEERLILLLQGTGDEFENRIFCIFHKFLKRCFASRSSSEEASRD